MALAFADWPANSHNMHVIRVTALAASAVLLLSGCIQSATPDPSAAPAKPKDFCHAMTSAAELAKPAATGLDTLFTTIDDMAAGSKEGDIANLHTVGETSTAASEAYAAALGTAASMAPTTLSADITALQEYWTLYAVGLGQIAQDAPNYGNLVDQTAALSGSEQASALIQEQPSVQKRINAGYLAECAG